MSQQILTRKVNLIKKPKRMGALVKYFKDKVFVGTKRSQIVTYSEEDYKKWEHSGGLTRGETFRGIPQTINYKDILRNRIISQAIKCQQSRTKKEWKQNVTTMRDMIDGKMLGRNLFSPRELYQLNVVTNMSSFAYAGSSVSWPSSLTDWSKRKTLTINGAVKTATLDEAFTDDQSTGDTNWVRNDTGSSANRFDAANDELDFDFAVDNTNNSVIYDLGSAVGSYWKLRFQCDLDNMAAPASDSWNGSIGLFSADQATGGNSNQNSIGINLMRDSGGATEWRCYMATNHTPANIPSDQTFDTTLATGTHYIEIIARDGVYIWTRYADSDYTQVLDTKTDSEAAHTDLRYLGFKNHASSGSGGSMDGSIKNLKLWDGDDVEINLPSQQTASLTVDLSSSSGWTTTDSNAFSVDTGNEEIDFDVNTASNSDEDIYKDINGAAFSDTHFVMRFVQDVDTYTHNTSAGNNDSEIFIGSSTGDHTTVQDSFGLSVQDFTGVNKYRVFATNADDPRTPASSTDFTVVGLYAGTIYWEFVRNGDTFTARAFSDSNYSNLLEQQSVTVTSVSGLRYFHYSSRDHASNNGEWVGSVHDIKVWDGISEVNPTTLSNYVLPVKILGDSELQRRTTPTREDLMDSTSGWTEQDSNEIGIANGVLTANSVRDTSNNGTSYNLGTALSDTKWTLDCDIKWTSITQTDANSLRLYVGMRDTNSATQPNGTSDFLGIGIHVLNIHNRYGIMDINNGSMDVEPSPIAGVTPAEGKELFIRMQRLSGTHFQVITYADKARTIELDRIEETSVSASITGLDEFYVSDINITASTSNTLTVEIDNLRIWDDNLNPVDQETATNTEDFSTYEEAVTPTLTENFDGTNLWAVSGTDITFDAAQDEIDFNVGSSASDHGELVYDLENILGVGGRADDEHWTLRFEVDIDNYTANSASSCHLIVGLTDGDESVAYNGSQDSISVGIPVGTNDDEYYAHYGAATNFGDSANKQLFTTIVSTGTKYFQITRDSSTQYTVRLYSDSGYTTLVEEQVDTGVTSATNALRYIAVKSRRQAFNVHNGSIRNVKFWNGISQTVRPIEETVDLTEDLSSYETAISPSLEVDLSSATGWTQGGDNLYSVDTGNEEIDFDSSGASGSLLYYDRGTANIDDDAWVYDFQIDLDTLGQTTPDNNAIYFGLDSANTAFSNTRDYVGFVVRTSNTADLVDMGLVTANGQDLGSGQWTLMTGSDSDISVGTYYIRITRNGDDFTCKAYTDSARTNQIYDTATITKSGITGLRYQTVLDWDTTTSALNGSISNIKLWNGVSQTVSETESTPTIDEDFSYADQTAFEVNWDGNPDFNEISFDAVNDRLNFDIEASPDEAVTRGITAVSDSQWVCRFHWHLTTQTDPSTGNIYTGVGLWSHNNLRATAQDAIWFESRSWSGTNVYRVRDAENEIMSAGAATAFTKVPTTGDDFWVEIKRTSTTNVDCSMYADAGFTNLIETVSLTIDALTGGLDRVGMKVVEDGGGTATGNVTDGYIEDLKVWDNTTSATVLNDTWTENDPDKISVNLPNERIDFESVRGSNDNAYRALGFNMGSTGAFRFEYTSTTLTVSHTNDIYTRVDISDDGTTGGNATATGGLGLFHRVKSGEHQFEFFGNGATSAILSLTPTVDTTYYVEILKTSATTATMNIYSDSNYLYLLESASLTGITESTTQDTLAVRNRETSASTSNVNIGHVDNIKVWNNEFPTTVQNAWVSSDPDKVSVNLADENIDWQFKRDTTDVDAISYDLTSVDKDEWCWRNAVEITTLASDGNFMMHLSSTQNADTDTSADRLGFSFYNPAGSNFEFYLIESDGAGYTIGSASDTGVAKATGTYYLEIKKKGTSLTATMYSDSAYTIVQYTKTWTISLSSSDLRYMTYQNYNGNTGSVTLVGTVDDISFWNGSFSPNASGRKIVFTNDDDTDTVTEYSSKTISYDPIAGDLEAEVKISSLSMGADTDINMYYEYTPASNPSYVPSTVTPTANPIFGYDMNEVTENFESYTTQAQANDETGRGWEQQGGDVAGKRVNISTNVLELSVVRDGSDDSIGRNIGILSNDRWIIDFKLRFAAYNNSSGAGNLVFYVGMSDSAMVTNFDNAQDFFGVVCGNGTGFLGHEGWSCIETDGASPQSNINSGENITQAWATSTDYYFRIIRVSNTLGRVQLYSDAARTTLIATSDITLPSTVENLTWLKVGNTPAATTTGTMDIEIDDISVYNGINSLSANREADTYYPDYKGVYHLDGNAVDSTVFGNNGTETNVDHESQNNNVGAVFDGASGDIDMGTGTSLDDIWENGSHVEFTIRPNSDGEGDLGRVIDKRHATTAGWVFNMFTESSGAMKFQYIVEMSGAASQWRSASDIILVGELAHIVIDHKSSGTNRPVIKVNGIVYTVENGGLTETAAGSGTVDDDSGNAFMIGSNAADTRTFDGFINNVKVIGSILSSSHSISTYNGEKENTDMITAGSEVTQA